MTEDELGKAAAEYCQGNIPHLNDMHLAISTAFEAGAEWQERQSEQKWTSVKDKLPFMDESLVNDCKITTKKVLCVTANGNYFAACMVKLDGTWMWSADWKPVMWMPIPELPKRR